MEVDYPLVEEVEVTIWLTWEVSNRPEDMVVYQVDFLGAVEVVEDRMKVESLISPCTKKSPFRIRFRYQLKCIKTFRSHTKSPFRSKWTNRTRFRCPNLIQYQLTSPIQSRCTKTYPIRWKCPTRSPYPWKSPSKYQNLSRFQCINQFQFTYPNITLSRNWYQF